MKKIIFLMCLILPALSLYGRAIQEDYKNADDKAKTSYAFGMLMGSNLSSMNVELDYIALAEGVRAVVEKLPPQFSEQEAMEIVEASLQRAMNKQTDDNRLLEEEFLAKNRERPGVQVTPSGLQYEILEEGDGETPSAASVVKVNYVGTFIDGSPFDSSQDEDGVYIPLNMVISGWSEGLQLMREGGKYRFYLPSSLAYGKEGVQSVIPPYSPLIFTVDLLEVVNDEDTKSFTDSLKPEINDYTNTLSD